MWKIFYLKYSGNKMNLRTTSLFIMLIINIFNIAQGQSNKSHKNKLIGKSVCEISKNVTTNLDYICRNAKLITHISEENCLLKLIDSLETLSIQAHDVKAFTTLDSLAKYSDGYVSDCLDDDIPKIFYYNFNGLINYLYSNPDNYLRDLLVDGLSLKVSMEGDRAGQMNEIKLFKDRK